MDWWKLPPFEAGLYLESRLFADMLQKAREEYAHVGVTLAEVDEKRKLGEISDSMWEFAQDLRRGSLLYGAGVVEMIATAIYHWVERTLKVELRRLGGSAGGAALASIKHALSRAVPGLDWNRVAHNADIELLRLFANSWKHEPHYASSGLRNAIGVTTLGVLDGGLLACHPMREGVAKKLNLSPDTSAIEIVATMLERAHDFLRDLGRVVAAGHAGTP